MKRALDSLIGELLSQWREKPLLRWGTMLILMIVWIEALFRVGDLGKAWQEEAVQAAARIQKADGTQGKRWQQRVDDARQAQSAWIALAWPSEDRGLVEAKVQDQVRELCAKLGLNVREIGLLAGLKGEDAVRLRLVVEHQRTGLLGLLGEIARLEHPLVLERLQIKLQTQPTLAEFELRAPLAPKTR